MSGLGYLGMAYAPIQRPVPSGMKQATTIIWNKEYGLKYLNSCENATDFAYETQQRKQTHSLNDQVSK